MGCGCCGGMCGRCRAGKKVVGALLVLLNAFVWPLWAGIDGWIKWFAVLALLGGLVHLIKPNCGHCADECEVPEKGKKKK